MIDLTDVTWGADVLLIVALCLSALFGLTVAPRWRRQAQTRHTLRSLAALDDFGQRVA